MRVLLAPLLALAAAACATTAPTRPEPQRIDFLELMGIKLPQGAELQRMIDAAAPYPLGGPRNPVRAAGADGQRAYLARLRCPDGRRPSFFRQFAAAADVMPFGRIVDTYGVTCPGAALTVVHLDLYHPGHVETAPVPGFTIVGR